jgi:hypothetical protein
LLFLNVLHMNIFQFTIGEVDNDGAMTINASFQLTCAFPMHAKELQKRQDVAGMDKIVHVLRQIAWVICMCEGSKAIVEKCRVCPAAVQHKEMRLRRPLEDACKSRVTVGRACYIGVQVGG